MKNKVKSRSEDLLFYVKSVELFEGFVNIRDTSVEELGVSVLKRSPRTCLVVVHCATEEAVGEVVKLGGEKSAKVDDNGLTDEVEHEGVVALVSVSELHSFLKECGSDEHVALVCHKLEGSCCCLGVSGSGGEHVGGEGECHAGIVVFLLSVVLRYGKDTVGEGENPFLVYKIQKQTKQTKPLKKR